MASPRGARAFQLVVLSICCVTLNGSVLGFGGVEAMAMVLGAEGLREVGAALHNHLRAIGVMFTFVGMVVGWSVMNLREGRTVFRLAVVFIVLAGFARMTGWLVDGFPGPLPVTFMTLELAVFPPLLLWHARLLRGLEEPAPSPR